MANPAERTLNQSASLQTVTRPTGEYRPPALLHIDCSIVPFSAPEIGTHRFATWPGLRVETVQGMRHTPFEYGFLAPWHLLITTEITECHDDKTFVESPPRSALCDFTRTLTFVPAGHGFSGFLKLRTPTRTTCFYIDPRWPQADLELRCGKVGLTVCFVSMRFRLYPLLRIAIAGPGGETAWADHALVCRRHSRGESEYLFVPWTGSVPPPYPLECRSLGTPQESSAVTAVADK
jgi:hypothetical protein